MGSDESHFNVSLIVRDKVTRQCPQTTTFEEKGEPKPGIEPKSFRLPAYRLTARPNRLSDYRDFQEHYMRKDTTTHGTRRGLTYNWSGADTRIAK